MHGKAANFSQSALDPNTGDVVAQDDTRLDLFEVDGYFIRGDWTLQGQVGVGRQKQRVHHVPAADRQPARRVKWWGLSALAAYKFEPRFEGVVRADYINNKKNGGGLLQYLRWPTTATASARIRHWPAHRGAAWSRAATRAPTAMRWRSASTTC